VVGNYRGTIEYQKILNIKNKGIKNKICIILYNLININNLGDIRKMKSINLFVIFVLGLFLIGTGMTSVSAADIEISGVSTPSGDPLHTVTVTFTATNHAAVLRTIIFTSTDITHIITPEYSIPAPQIPGITLNAGESKQVSFGISIPSTLSGSYDGAITAEEFGNSANQDTLSYILTVNPLADIKILDLDSGKLKMTGSEDSDISTHFKIKNTGSVICTPNVAISGDFEDDNNNAILFDSITVNPINPGDELTITVSAEIENGINIGTYMGTADVTTEYPDVTESFPVEVNVEPEICEDGRVSDEDPISSSSSGNLRISIDEPDNGDNFRIGEDLKISVKVKNENDDNMDVVVEAILYDIDNDEEVVSVESDSEEIKENKNKDFDLTLEIPSDENLDDDDTYILYVKAYEDGDEDKNCNYDSVGLDLNRNNYDVIIKSFTAEPSVASCNDMVNFKVEVVNIGKKSEDDVYIRLLSSALGIDQSSTKFDLDEYDKSDNDMIKTFTFTTPKNAEEKEYSIEAIVYYRDGRYSKSDFASLTLKNCAPKNIWGTGATINAPQTSFSVKQGGLLTLPFTVRNNEATPKTYTIEVLATGWGESMTETKTLIAGQEIIIHAYVNINSDATQGSQAAIINVKEGSSIIASKSVNVNIQAVGTTGTGAVTVNQPTTVLGSFLKNNGDWLLISGVLILIILVVLLMVLVAKK